MPVEAWANTVTSLLRPDWLAWAVLNAQRGQGLRPCCCRACGPPWSALRTVAASPVKLILLAGGSALITLAYIGGLAASVQAFGGHAGITEIGAVYLGAAVIAAASPPPAASAPSRPPWSRAGPASAYLPGPQSRRSSPTGSPPTGCPSSPAGPPGGFCKDETTYDAPDPQQPVPTEGRWNT
jgi:hypothetical protein